MPAILKNKSFLLPAVWAIVQGVLLLNHGIVTTGESSKYIREAESILSTGKTLSPNFWSYSVQSLLIIIDKKLKAGFLLAVSVQLLFSLWATFSFYNLIKKFFSASLAFWGTIIFLLNYPFQEFNTFLQTESLYNSFTIIFTSYLLRLSSLKFSSIVTILISVILISITRPAGMLFILSAAVYIIAHFRDNIRKAYLFAGTFAAILLFLFSINLVMSIGGRFDFMLPFRTGQVICYIPEQPSPNDLKLADNGNSLYGLFYYITHNVGHFSGLAIKKFIAFFGLTRPYFSFGHNAFLAAYFYPLYLTSLLSLSYWVKHNIHALLYLGSVVFLALATTLLTCDDWHNRFFLSISPYFIILSIPAIKSIILPIKPFFNDRRRI